MNYRPALGLLLIIVIGVAFMTADVKAQSTLTPEQTEYVERLKKLDTYYSSKPLGAIVENGSTIFRIFVPQAKSVTLCVFEKPEDTHAKEFSLTRDNDGVWEISVNSELTGKYYGYKIDNPFNDDNDLHTIVLDPYAKAVTTFNTYMNPRKGIVVKEGDYDWEGVDWIKQDWRDAIIYEMHLRDMTAHPSSGAKYPGQYKGLTEKGITGGLDYIKSLGVNTVELLPAQEFANIEIPYRDSMAGRFNTWNPYARNYWGYMTAAFFAPEAYYAENWERLNWNVWEGKKDIARNAFKDMVKAFKKEGIAVVMDVVYNHTSEYELGGFKQIDKDYYYRLTPDGHFVAQSYCGNDFKTERPMTRRLIVESLIYWMKEYKIDGFRFDLGKLIDWGTVEEVIKELRKINPDVIVVCEPWGGGYDPNGFSQRGWGSWNDQIRNGIKGENPYDNHGWIFGKWFGNNTPERVKSYVNGTLTRDSLGLFINKETSVNYLESHDGYTLGDFIRIGLGDAKESTIIEDVDDFQKLTPKQMKLNKLAALFLFTSQGMTMIHTGQEYARTKVVPLDVEVSDPLKGRLDHNTYDKDNGVNYINYEHAKANNELFKYYQGLIELRKKYDSFRRAEYEEVTFLPTDKKNPFSLGYEVKHKGEHFVVLFNANPDQKKEFTLPAGEWEIIVNEQTAGTSSLGSAKSTATLPPSTGMVLRKKN